MVEMRWIIREEAKFDEHGEFRGYHDSDRVLQYREGSAVEHDYYGRIENWSEWQDVPVMREGEGWTRENYCDSNLQPTHFQPLPEPPKEPK